MSKKISHEEKMLLRRRMNEYLLSGFGIPKGLEEEWERVTNQKYKPSGMVERVYWIITGNKYVK